MSETQVAFYNKLLVKFGDHQIIVAIEELSELQKELCKVLREEGSYANTLEEIVDTIIMLEQMILYFGITEEELEQIKIQKIERTKNRLQL